MPVGQAQAGRLGDLGAFGFGGGFEVVPGVLRDAEHAGSKAFFFEKKQKLLSLLSRAHPQHPTARKVFWFFSSKKNRLLPSSLTPSSTLR